VGPFAGRRPALSGPLSLQVDFDSVTASAHLRWEQARVEGFLYYRIERARHAGFEAVAEIESATDTSYVDKGLLATTANRYRVIAVWGEKDDDSAQSLATTTVEGGIHRFLNSWSLPRGFLPTRLAMSKQGVLHVVGAGAGQVERFDRGGNSMGQWQFAQGPNACLETAVLDGPSLSFDSKGNLYVVYNLLEAGRAPLSFWTKFDASGRLQWTRPLEMAFARHIAIDGDDIYIEGISRLKQFDAGGEAVADYPIPALLVSSLRFWGGHFAALVEPLSFANMGWQAPRLVVYTSADRSATDFVIGRDPLSPEDRGAGLLSRPSDFATDEATNRVFVVNAGHRRIEVFKDNVYLTRWSEVGVDEVRRFRFSGQFPVIDNLSTGTTRQRTVTAGGISRDREGFLYVADTFNDRIQKFQP
jgi:hypothetical protein